MEAKRASESSVDNHFTRQYNPEDNSEHQGHSCLSLCICVVLCVGKGLCDSLSLV
jgi:hypothetical protein